MPAQPVLPAHDVLQQPLALVELAAALAEDGEVGRDLGLGLAVDLGRDVDRVVAAVLVGCGSWREKRVEEEKGEFFSEAQFFRLAVATLLSLL